jgi:hypothetical protein
MIVAFLHYGQDPKHAEAMVRSVRKHMDCVVAQWTDAETPKVEGADLVKRGNWDKSNPMLFKMGFLIRQVGDALVLDTDVIVQADLSHVFSLPFDIGLTWRDGPIFDPDGNDLTRIMPYNCGVMFHRNPDFWRSCLEWCEGKPVGWYADQLAVAAVAPKFDTLRLHCDNFNYTPRKPDEDVSKRLAVHYKGKRKAWMPV